MTLFSLYVFKDEDFIFDVITELPCLGDFENPDLLPVQEVLRGTYEVHRWFCLMDFHNDACGSVPVV